MNDPKVDPKLDEILNDIVWGKTQNARLGAEKQATQALLEWAEGLCVEARKSEIELLRDTMKLGGDINTKTWMSFDFENYFKDCIAELEAKPQKPS